MNAHTVGLIDQVLEKVESGGGTFSLSMDPEGEDWVASAH